MLAHICDATAEEDASDEKDGEYEACGQLSAWCVCGSSGSMRGIGDCENECESEGASECDRQSVSASGSSGSCALWVLNEHIGTSQRSCWLGGGVIALFVAAILID